MSKLTLYTGLKADLETIAELKYVGMWRNNLERESEENPFLFPAALIQFMPSEYADKGNTATSQQYTMGVRIHILFESYKDEDTAIFALVDNVWQKVHLKRYGNWSKLVRRNEEQNFDHDNVQDYMQDYSTLGNDNIIPIGTTTATLAPVITTTINTPDELT